MKQRWLQLAARIDALTLRERAILFGVCLVCCVALADTLFLSPARDAHAKVTAQYNTQTQVLQRMRAELQSTAAAPDVNAAVRNDISSLQQELDAVNADIRMLAPEAVGGPAIESTLVQLLRRQEGLTLLGTATAPSAAASAPAPNMPVRQALELRVSGSYAQLTRYIAALEATLPTLRWGPLHLSATREQPELKVEIVLLGVAP